jgi:hypothetical protein
MAIDAAGWLVEEDNKETKSFFSDYADLCRENENAIPGYDKA